MDNNLTGTTYEKKVNRKKNMIENFDPKNYISVGVSERDVELYKEVFDLFDVNNIGCLTPIDVRTALEIFGYSPSRRIVYELISNID